MITQGQREGLRLARQLVDYFQGQCHFSNYVKNEVIRLYWTLLQSGNTSGFERKRIMAALTYYVCNREGHGTSMQELSVLVGFDRHKLFKSLKNLRQRLLLPPIVPCIEGLIIKHGNELKMNPETISKAIRLANKVKDKVMNNPLVITGTCLYIAGQENNEMVSVKTIRNHLDISESTIYSLKRKIKNGL
jgi:transcription initiation factor TFIIIB Brf1 subunit/transcription initiation factor TFIIB